MPGIYPMAVVTVLVSAALWGGLAYALSGRDRRYLWLLLLGLPLSAAVNLGVKRPLGIAVAQAARLSPRLTLGAPIWFIVFLFLLAPVFEEAMKLVPLLLPPVRKMLTDGLAALWVGASLGIGFGLGEAIYLAYGVAQSPQYAGLPWYLFGGYFGERLVVSFAHGVMTALAVRGLSRGARRGLLGYLFAVGLHALLNVGAVLFQLGLIPTWGAQLSLIAPFLLMVGVFERQRGQASREVASLRASADEDEVVYLHRD